ncbi:permease prefix domain 2-containing transporter [Fulvivirga maritima]|uniref:permease prefix domain 2-containing transporter n=1 Tax=Fulvivirga maritima TaxID=2904247 RepID=UPI001F3A372C|nr:permease prefix domain 2-containing transporter [Fulvivirga maritima]UII28051.1 permease prefix domain 2-containing transporter [Fulvivirga maritima]
MKTTKKSIPPQLAERLLTWFLKDELAEEVLGDLDEKFYVPLQKGHCGGLSLIIGIRCCIISGLLLLEFLGQTQIQQSCSKII